MGGNPLYSSKPWRRLRARRLKIAEDAGEPCCRCHREIDYQLPGNVPWGPTVDHLYPMVTGGDELPAIDEVGPAHRQCNSKHGGVLGNVKQGIGPGSRGGNGNAKSRTQPRRSAPFPESSQGAPRPASFPSHTTASPTPSPTMTTTLPDLAFNPPRLESERHPRAVGSLGEDWANYFDAHIGPHMSRKIKLRAWQRHVLSRSLEIDANGKLCWEFVVITAPRQVGKSVLLAAGAVLRNEFAERFEEFQEVIHIASRLDQANRIQTSVHKWAASRDLLVRQPGAGYWIRWPDESHWTVSSVASAFGRSASLAMADECFAIELDSLESGLFPTMRARNEPQAWLMSTANEKATDLMPTYRKRALDGDPDVLLLEWSAPPNADYSDPAVWKAAQPYWDARQQKFLARHAHESSFPQEYLNIWPGQTSSAKVEWPVGWSDLPPNRESPKPGYVAVVEEHADRSEFGMALIRKRSDGGVDVWCRRAETVNDVMSQLRSWAPNALLVGLTLRGSFTGPWTEKGVGQREMISAVPKLADYTRRGLITHDQNADAKAQVENARTATTERGLTLSTRKSVGPIPMSKAVAWGTWAVSEGLVETERPRAF